jgi:hypothetical protein
MSSRSVDLQHPAHSVDPEAVKRFREAHPEAKHPALDSRAPATPEGPVKPLLAFTDTLERLYLQVIIDSSRRAKRAEQQLTEVWRAKKLLRAGAIEDIERGAYQLLTRVMELPSLVRKVRVYTGGGVAKLLDVHLEGRKPANPRPAKYAQAVKLYWKLREPMVKKGVLVKRGLTHEQALEKVEERLKVSPRTIEHELQIPKRLEKAMALRRSILGD